MLVILAVLLLLATLAHSQPLPEAHIVQRVIDGDTVVLENGDHVRLVGIDTPERGEPFAREATAFLRQRVENRLVRLEFEPASAKTGYRDYFGRLLAYIFRDGVLVNAEIVRQGYGRAYTRFPFMYREWFLALER